MSEQTKAELAVEREQMIRNLTIEDLDLLTDKQLQMVQRLQLKRSNDRARLRIEEALKGKEKDIALALTSAPFIYTTPEIRLMAGCVVRFSTLMTAQVRDAHKQLDAFIASENPNDLRTSDYLNRHLIAHALVAMNGQDFGGVNLDAADYQELRRTRPEDAEKTLETVREARLNAIDGLSSHILTRLIEAYQAFQVTIETMTQSSDMDEALGN